MSDIPAVVNIAAPDRTRASATAVIGVVLSTVTLLSLFGGAAAYANGYIGAASLDRAHLADLWADRDRAATREDVQREQLIAAERMTRMEAKLDAISTSVSQIKGYLDASAARPRR